MALRDLFGKRGSAPDFAEGQRWAYRTRQGEKGSTLLIQRIETLPSIGKVFHVTISDVRIENPDAPDGVSFEMAHVPVSLKTMEDSCTMLVEKPGTDDRYHDGYAQWKLAFDQGDAGVFTISVSEIVQGIELAIGQTRDGSL